MHLRNIYGLTSERGVPKLGDSYQIRSTHITSI